MSKIIVVSFMINFLFGCQTVAVKNARTATDCAEERFCRAAGILTMKSDGHAFIGELKLVDGSCLDVSLPEEVSREMINQPPREMQIQGLVFPYPYGEDIIGFKINGREIGFGLCGKFYVFVK